MAAASSIAETYGVKSSLGAWGLIKEGVWKDTLEAGRSKEMPPMPATDAKMADNRLKDVKVRESKL